MSPRRSERLREKRERAALPRRSERLRQLLAVSRPIRRIRRSRASAGSRNQVAAVVPPSPPSALIRRSRLEILRGRVHLPLINLQANLEARAWRLPSPAAVAGTSAATDPGAEGNSHVVRRLRREMQKFMNEPPEGCTVELVDDNIFHWRATITGPKDTPYEGGVFDLALVFTSGYPFEAPGVCFLTRVYHCNVGNTGTICMNILYRDWSPALTVPKLLLSIISLLSDPNPHDPLVNSIAETYLNDRDQYAENARMWTRQYANPINNQEDPHPADAD